MSAMDQLYQQLILDHAKHPQGSPLVEATAGAVVGEAHEVNPTCGDEVTMRIELDQSGSEPSIAKLSWSGQGCSISQASISVLTELVSGQSVAEAERLAGLFRDLMDTRGAGLESEDDLEALGDAAAFTGVSKYPARIKCALLGWSALRSALLTAQ